MILFEGRARIVSTQTPQLESIVHEVLRLKPLYKVYRFKTVPSRQSFAPTKTAWMSIARKCRPTEKASFSEGLNKLNMTYHS